MGLYDALAGGRGMKRETERGREGSGRVVEILSLHAGSTGWRGDG